MLNSLTTIPNLLSMSRLLMIPVLWVFAVWGIPVVIAVICSYFTRCSPQGITRPCFTWPSGCSFSRTRKRSSYNSPVRRLMNISGPYSGHG